MDMLTRYMLWVRWSARGLWINLVLEVFLEVFLEEVLEEGGFGERFLVFVLGCNGWVYCLLFNYELSILEIHLLCTRETELRAWSVILKRNYYAYDGQKKRVCGIKVKAKCPP